MREIILILGKFKWEDPARESKACCNPVQRAGEGQLKSRHPPTLVEMRRLENIGNKINSRGVFKYHLKMVMRELASNEQDTSQPVLILNDLTLISLDVFHPKNSA